MNQGGEFTSGPTSPKLSGKQWECGRGPGANTGDVTRGFRPRLLWHGPAADGPVPRLKVVVDMNNNFNNNLNNNNRNNGNVNNNNVNLNNNNNR